MAALVRDWIEARAKVDAEGECRVCPRTDDLQAAHTIGRTHDKPHPTRKALRVDPDDVVPLCGPCHLRYDAHDLNLIPHTTYSEQAAAVRHVGLDRALRRLSSGECVVTLTLSKIGAK